MNTGAYCNVFKIYISGGGRCPRPEMFAGGHLTPCRTPPSRAFLFTLSPPLGCKNQSQFTFLFSLPMRLPIPTLVDLTLAPQTFVSPVSRIDVHIHVYSHYMCFLKSTRNNGISISRAQCSPQARSRPLRGRVAIRLPVLYVCQQAAPSPALLLHEK